jgi:hypothetical protein
VGALARDGVIVLATPLPFRPCYYDGPATLAPREGIDVPGSTWEERVGSFVDVVLGPLGLDVLALTRAPYISGGDGARSLYVLDDLVIVCRRGTPACQ